MVMLGSVVTTEPVAMQMFFVDSVCFAPPSLGVNSTAPLPAMRPTPLNTVTLFFFIKKSMPAAPLSTTFCLCLCACAQSTDGFDTLMPNVAACSTWAYSSADHNSALVG